MRVVLQRVSRAAVTIDGRVAGAIDRGFCLLAGFTHTDSSAEVDWMAEKVSGLRLFSDSDGKMNLGLADVGGAVLVISQFTLYGDAVKGRRPSFIAAARPEAAIPLYQRFIEQLRGKGLRVETGEFGAMMQVEIHNDGPVSLVLERAGEEAVKAEVAGEADATKKVETLVLASASPRRKQLLEMLGIPIVVQPSHIVEVRGPDESPVAYTERLACEKALSVSGSLVLGADTTVLLDDALLEKPADAADALRILRLLQGRTHQVITSVALVADGRFRTATDITEVTFRPCDDDFLRAYIATGEPMDKAGAYGIQGYGAALVERIDGDFFGVMGLPVRLALKLLGEAGVKYQFGKTQE